MLEKDITLLGAPALPAPPPRGHLPNYDNRSRGFSQNIPRYLTPNFSKISDENEDFYRAVFYRTYTIISTMLKSELVSKAISFFTANGYQVQTQTEMLFVVISKKRQVNWLIFLILFCLGIIPAAIYYFLFSPRHEVTIAMTEQ